MFWFKAFDIKSERETFSTLREILDKTFIDEYFLFIYFANEVSKGLVVIFRKVTVRYDLPISAKKKF